MEWCNPAPEQELRARVEEMLVELVTSEVDLHDTTAKCEALQVTGHR